MEPEVVNELTVRTELLIEMYKIVEEITENRIDPMKLTKMAADFKTRSTDLRKLLKERFKEMKIML